VRDFFWVPFSFFRLIGTAFSFSLMAFFTLNDEPQLFLVSVVAPWFSMIFLLGVPNCLNNDSGFYRAVRPYILGLFVFAFGFAAFSLSGFLSQAFCLGALIFITYSIFLLAFPCLKFLQTQRVWLIFSAYLFCTIGGLLFATTLHSGWGFVWLVACMLTVWYFDRCVKSVDKFLIKKWSWREVFYSSVVSGSNIFSSIVMVMLIASEDEFSWAAVWLLRMSYVIQLVLLLGWQFRLRRGMVRNDNARLLAWSGSFSGPCLVLGLCSFFGFHFLLGGLHGLEWLSVLLCLLQLFSLVGKRVLLLFRVEWLAGIYLVQCVCSLFALLRGEASLIIFGALIVCVLVNTVLLVTKS